MGGSISERCVHLVVERSDVTYSQRFDEDRLAHLLYLVHVLEERNGYMVVLGYSDLIGVLARAAGGSTIATGWYQSLRRFHRKAFLYRKPGGQPSRDRYSSAPLMNSIFLGELQSIFEIGEMGRVLSGSSRDNVITSASSPEASTWNRPTSELQHWETIRSLDQALTGSAKTNVPSMIQRLWEAIGLYKELEGGGIAFDRLTNGDHLTEWARALQRLRQLVRV